MLLYKNNKKRKLPSSQARTSFITVDSNTSLHTLMQLTKLWDLQQMQAEIFNN